MSHQDMRILEQDAKVYIIASGAGAGLQRILWDVPGISKVLVGAEFPYATQAIDSCLGYTPEKYSAPETAIDLAIMAYYKAVATGAPKALGLGLTASVATNEIHRGDHRCYIAILSDTGCRLVSIILAKHSGRIARMNDGLICDEIALHHLVGALGLDTVDYTDHAASVVSSEVIFENIKDFEKRFFLRPYFRANGKREPLPVFHDECLFPGSFDPPHEGHFGIADEVKRRSRCSVVFEITVNPPHKDKLTVQTMLRRARLLEGHDRVFTKDDPLYIDKAKHNPGVAMIIGADTLVRMLDPKWGPSVKDIMTGFDELGTRFHVASRAVDGTFTTIDDIREDPKFVAVRNELYQCCFSPLLGRWDISSTEIREKQA